MIGVFKTKLEGVLLIRPPTIFNDVGGTWVETYNEEAYGDVGIDVKFVEED